MSRFLASVAGAAVFIGSASNAAAPASPPPDAAKLAEAHAIINVMFPPNSRESMLTQLQSQTVTDDARSSGLDAGARHQENYRRLHRRS